MGIFKKDKSTIIEGAVGLVKNIRGMIDDSKFTNEEKARYNFKIAEASAQFVKDTLSENTERSRTRRSIAVEFMRFFYFLTAAVILMWYFNPAWALFTKDLIIEFKLGWAFVTVIIFFFGGYVLKQYTGSKEKAK